MNATTAEENFKRAQEVRQQAQTNQTLKILETLKNDFQSSLLAESQSFKDAIYETARKLQRLLRLALALTALAVLASLFMFWKTNQMEKVDNYQFLRDQNLVPLGQPTTSPEGQIFIELRKME